MKLINENIEEGVVLRTYKSDVINSCSDVINAIFRIQKSPDIEITKIMMDNYTEEILDVPSKSFKKDTPLKTIFDTMKLNKNCVLNVRGKYGKRETFSLSFDTKKYLICLRTNKNNASVITLIEKRI